MHLFVLGPIELRSAVGAAFAPAGAKQRLLLGTLTLNAPRPVSSDRLVDLLWGDDPPVDPGAALRTQLSRLRSLLREAGLADRLQRGVAGSALQLDADEIDGGVFEALHRRAVAAATADEALALAEEALALWRGDPYGELRDLQHFAAEAARLNELWIAVNERRAQCLLALGRTADALQVVAALVEADPLRERARALEMQALHAAGRPHDALAAFQGFRRLLSTELGLSPSPALRAIETAIVQHAQPAMAEPVVGPAGADRSSARPAAPGVARPAGPGTQPPESATTTDPSPSAALRQEIRFARSADGVRLAYATVGAGPPLVKAANWLNHLEFDWESPVWRRLFRELATGRQLIRYDERACGLSDPDPVDMSLDAWVLDLESIVDACSLDRFPLLGISQGCAVCIEYAARHPERVTALILHGGYAAGWRVDPEFGAAEVARRDASIDIVRHGWGEDTPAYRQMFTLTFIPGGTPAEIEWFNELQRRTATPENAARFMEAFAYLDVRDRLAEIRAPTLVLHSRNDQRIHFDRGRDLATAIPGARFVPLESENHLILEHEPAFDVWMRETLAFLAEVANA